MSDAVSRVNDSPSEGSLSHLSRGPRRCQRQYRLHGGGGERGREGGGERGREGGGERGREGGGERGREGGGGRGREGEGGGRARERMEEKRSETRQVEEICRVGKLYEYR